MGNSRLIFALWALLAPGIQSLSWGGERRAVNRESDPRRTRPTAGAGLNIPPASALPSFDNKINPSELLQQPSSRLSNVYAVALSELQELESEPLCHRVAARLLVRNCQLVDGMDEATILTDSGRRVQDYVDSYAASLAICDLERGSFTIPPQCTRFREPSLSELTIRNEPQLHVSTREIKLCLAALGTSDAAWNTWISYRHKALRFCEAARADNEKSQNIVLYQRLTQVIAKLTDGVEAELQKRMNDIDNRTRQSVENLEKLSPQIDHLRDNLAGLGSYVDTALGKSSESARNLQRLMDLMVANILESNSRLASVHEVSLQKVSQRVDADLGALMAVVATVAASSNSLQQQIEFSNQQAAALAHRQVALEQGMNRQGAALAQRQDALEQGMDRLLVATQTISEKYEDHTHTLNQAKNITNDLLDTLEETAATASSVQGSLLKDATSGHWWPYIAFPTLSLVLGSYGLTPCLFRNIGLLALGEGIFFVVSSYDQLIDNISLPIWTGSNLNTNVTTASPL